MYSSSPLVSPLVDSTKLTEFSVSVTSNREYLGHSKYLGFTAHNVSLSETSPFDTFMCRIHNIGLSTHDFVMEQGLFVPGGAMALLLWSIP